MEASATKSLFVTPIADDLFADPNQLLHVASVLRWLAARHAEVLIVIPCRRAGITLEDAPDSFARIARSTCRSPVLLTLSEAPEQATRDLAAFLLLLDDGTERFACGPESGGLLAAAAQAKRAGLGFAGWTFALIPNGIESLRLERRCEFTHAARSADCELLERDLLRAADTILIETPLQDDYVSLLAPASRREAVTLPLPAACLAAPATARRLASDRIVFLGQFTTAGGLEVLRSVLQQFARWKRRLHVTLAGCIGASAYGDPFQLLAESLADLPHAFDILHSNDPARLLASLDGSALILVADRLPLRLPLADAARARGLPVLCLFHEDWARTWQGSAAEALIPRYVVGKTAATMVRDILDGGHCPGHPAAPSPHQPAHGSGSLPPGKAEAAGDQAVGAFAVLRMLAAEQADRPGRAPWPGPTLDVVFDGETGRLHRAGRAPMALPSCSLAAAIEAILATADGPVIAVASGGVVPTLAWRDHQGRLAQATASHGVVLGDHQGEGAEGRRTVPPRHLLQALWQPEWDAPLVHYATAHLATLLRVPRFRAERFSPFTLWACSLAAGATPLVVPAVLSWSPPGQGRADRIVAARRRVEALIALSDAAGVLPRALAAYIHGVQHCLRQGPVASTDSGATAAVDAAAERLRHVADPHGRHWLLRLAELLAALGRPGAGLVALDQASRAAGGREDPESAALRAGFAAALEGRPHASPAEGAPRHLPDAAQARAVIDRCARMEAERQLAIPDVALVSEIGLPLADVERLILARLDDYRSARQWRLFNALLAVYGRQFGHERAERARRRPVLEGV